jgi:hypothetical protein
MQKLKHRISGKQLGTLDEVPNIDPETAFISGTFYLVYIAIAIFKNMESN